jgi:hypothetical protein
MGKKWKGRGNGEVERWRRHFMERRGVGVNAWRRSFLSRRGRRRLGRPGGPRAGRWATSGPKGATRPDGKMDRFWWARPKAGIE